MAAVDRVLLASKFRGTLIGALLGDCLGAPYESEEMISKRQLQSYFDKMEGPYAKGVSLLTKLLAQNSGTLRGEIFNFKRVSKNLKPLKNRIDWRDSKRLIPYKPYTDDTAMTRCVAKSIIENKGVNEDDIAKKFVTEFYREPNRGYGGNIINVFDKLLNTKCSDPFGPAKEQFNGSGSYGNGAAMRTSPVALFYYDNPTALINMASKVSKITHAHELGINGAVLQSLAIRKSLLLNPKDNLDVGSFASELIEEMKSVEKDDDDPLNITKYSYGEQLTVMKDLLLKKQNPADEEIINKLGNSISSIFSVPTAIYCFLRAKNSIPDIETDNFFRRTVQYAISLGGDTDTIASMAGAIAGAYFGVSSVNENLQKHCEKVDETIRMADELFKLKHS